MALVILQTEVHCLRCARKIRRAIEHHAGVESVWASPETGLVFVAGTADASALQRRVEARTGRPVTVVSDGERCYPTYTRMEHLGPPQQQGYPQPSPSAASPYVGGGWYSGPVGWAPAVVVPPRQQGYQYQYHHQYAPAERMCYVPDEAPVYFSDENANACCIQ